MYSGPKDMRVLSMCFLVFILFLYGSVGFFMLYGCSVV